MSKSAMVSVRDALRIVELCHELRELPPIAAVRRQHVAVSTRQLIGARLVAIGDGTDFSAATRPRLELVQADGWLEAKGQEVFGQYLQSVDHDVDPTLPALSKVKPRLFTRRREELVDDRRWYGTDHVAEERRAAEVDDVTYSVYRKDRGGRIHILAIHRDWNDRRRFTRREQALVNLLHRATAAMLESSPDAPLAQLEAALSPRMRQVLGFLRTGLAEKEIASRLGLSKHTIHGYVKQIYLQLGVESRAELMAMCQDTERSGEDRA